MKQTYGIAALLLNFSFICLAQPVTIANYSKLEANKEEKNVEPNETQIKPNSAVESNEKGPEAETTNTSEKYDKNIANSDILETPKDISSSTEAQNNTDERQQLENNYLPFDQLMPDFTDEEYSEMNKEGATPWNFLKHINDKENANVPETDTTQDASITKIYINIPIVINSDTSLPISLTIGGKTVRIKETSGTIDPSLLIKLKDYKVAPARETNRHRSNFNNKIFANN